MSTNAERLVRDFLAAWPRKNVDELMGYFAADAVYHNVPVAPRVGTAAIREAFQGFCDMMNEGIELEVLNVVADGSVVMAERIDRFRWQGKKLDLPVCGVFEVVDGKIVHFRDYFDLPSWQNATGVPL